MNLICAAVILVGFSKPYTERDEGVFKRAPVGCAQIYPQFPCVKKIIRKEDGVYNILCGKEKK